MRGAAAGAVKGGTAGRTRSLVLCADDYGMNDGVSAGILDLARAGRISAASCMANAPGWPKQAEPIADFAGRIGIGLHLCFTWGTPLGAMPGLAPEGRFPALGTLLARAVSGRLAASEIRAEIARQVDAFVAATGRAPDFVDGHQHVHVLPTLRGALLAELSDRGWAGRVWLRDPSDRWQAVTARRLSAGKALFVGALATGFRDAARRVGFATNEGFSGFSPFEPARDVGADIGRYLQALGPRPLVMCHPGRPDPSGAPDEIAAARAAEYAYLESAAFGELLRERAITLAPAPT